MENETVIIERFMAEQRRGSLILVVLSMLKEPLYGYALARKLEGSGLAVSQDTLYPMLRRLEDQGLLESSWIVDENRPRKYYRTAEPGIHTLEELSQRWLHYTETIKEILR